MIGETSILEKNAKCTAAITTAFTIAKFGADDDTLALAGGIDRRTDRRVSAHHRECAAIRCALCLRGSPESSWAGRFTRGIWATSDADGKAVAAAPAAGVNASVVGRFMASGVDGDIVPLLIQLGRIQG